MPVSLAAHSAAAADDGLDTASASLRHYLRALWAREYALRPVDRPATQLRPYLSELGIHLPPHYQSHRGALLRDLYRAAAAHAAAHDTFSTVQFERRQLKPVQLAIIGVLEDARVEQLAMSTMPGLRSLWLKFFDPRGREGTSAEALLLRLAHVLLDPSRTDGNPWVMKGRQLYLASQAQGSDPRPLREVGILLGNDLGQMRAQFNAKTYLVEPPYRDDNLFLWDSDAPPEETKMDDAGWRTSDAAAPSTPRFDDATDEVAHFKPREVAAANDTQGRADADPPRYPEWDQRTGRYRPDWCSIIEQRPQAVDATPLRQRLAGHASLSGRLARLLQARKLGQPQRLRRQAEGEEFEIDALVDAQSALRSGQLPALNVYRRTKRQKPDLSVLLLLDLSASTETVAGESTLLSLIREASALLAGAVAQGGDRIAIHGFRSNGRHEVNYLRFKEFGQPLDDAALGRLCAVDGALSTRMGAAIRHAGRLMRDCRSTQRLIIVLTDGEPHDIDTWHPGLLLHDAARAVQQQAAEGTPVFCVSVDPQADKYVRRIFGPHNYVVLDRIDQLPQRLPELYLRLAG